MSFCRVCAVIPDRSWSVLYVRHLLRRLRSGLWEGKLRPPGSGRLQQPVHAEEADLRTSPCHQKGFLVQGLGRSHASVHERRGSVQLGRWRLRETGTRQQLHTEIPQTRTGTPSGKGTEHLVECTHITLASYVLDKRLLDVRHMSSSFMLL